jgi:hypothetical protein
MVQTVGVDARMDEEVLIDELLRWAGSRTFLRGQIALGFGQQEDAV